MSPSASSSSEVGNDRTSVALSLPRNWRFSSRILWSETNAMVAVASGEPITPSIFRASNRHCSVSIFLRRWRFTTSTIEQSRLDLTLFAMCFVGFDDHLDEFVTNDVFLGEVDKLNS